MAAKLVSIFYSQLLDSEKPLDETTQLSAYKYFLREKKYKELGRLAARPDTLAALDSLLGSRNELGVLTGWLRRPGRTSEEIVSRLTKEKRVSALLTLAEIRDLPADVYERIARADSPKISVVLLANPSVPRALRVRRACGLFANENFSSWDSTEAAKASMAFDPGFASALAAEVTSLEGVLFCLENSTVSREHASRFLNFALAVEKATRNDERSGRYYRVTTEDIFCRLAGADLPEEENALLAKVLSRRAKQRSNHYYGRDDVERAIAVLENKNSEFNTLLREFVDCTDPTRAGERFTALLSSASTYQKEEVLSAACRHQALPSSFMLPQIENLRNHEDEILVREWDRRGDVKALVAGICETFYGGHWLEYVSDPLTILLEVCRYCSENDQSQPYWLTRHPLLLENPERVVGALAWPQLLLLAADDPRLKNEVTTQVVARLGDNPLLWENFDSLGEEFSGTLPELLETVTSI
jgi:hypothetical protein